MREIIRSRSKDIQNQDQKFSCHPDRKKGVVDITFYLCY